MPVRPAPVRGLPLPLLPNQQYLKRTSKVWPTPVIDPLTGVFSGWNQPSSQTIADVGFYRIWVNGVDVTYLEPGGGGALVPTEILEYSYAEPFGPLYARFKFPSIWAWDGQPGFLLDGCCVDIDWVTPANVATTIWEGIYSGDHIEEDESAGSLIIECRGALYEADQYVEPPDVLRRERDCGAVIRDLMTSPQRFTWYTPPAATVMGVTTDRTSSFTTALTGAVADVLARANQGPNITGSEYWTVAWSPGRVATIQRRNPITNPTWTVVAGASGVSMSLHRDLLSAPTAIYGEGIAPDGCRWRNMKTPPSTGAAANADARYTADEGRVLPLFRKPETSYYTYGTDGNITGVNGAHDPTVMVVEKFVGFGERVKLVDAKAAAQRDVADWPADWIGTITLNDDPEEGTRRLIQAGQTIRLRNFYGSWPGQRFHIARAEHDPSSGTVTLTVDQKGRDIQYVDALITRTREAHDAARRGARGRRSLTTEDRIVAWDCEAGSGIIRPTTLVANTWKIIRVGAAEAGTVIRTAVECSVATRFVTAVFSYPVTLAALNAAGNPLSVAGFWRDYTAVEDDRPLVSWGGMLPDGTIESAGFYPGLETESATLTGKHVDDATWEFYSRQPPWLWVAVRAEANCTFHGGTLADGYRAFRVGVD